ncbi:hypothetical protein PFISCL1PPCAC_23201, partial [Pristionchus fissidentatus]
MQLTTNEKHTILKYYKKSISIGASQLRWHIHEDLIDGRVLAGVAEWGCRGERTLVQNADAALAH